MIEPAKSVVIIGLDALEAIRQIVREELSQNNGGKSQDTNPYLTTEKAAKLAGVCSSTIRQKIRQGELPVCRFGRRVLIKRLDIERFVESHRTGGDHG